MAKNRYIGEYPVIGIRPIVDGRRGPMQLRESLEDQVMAMAEAAKKLFEENLYYSNGEPVKVVMADTSIGRVPESAACAEKFKREGVAITLSVTPCWCYGSETMDMDPMTIKGVWGFNGTERPGAVYLASVLATHAQKGLPAFGIYGHEVQDRDQVTEIPDDVKEKLLRVNSMHIGYVFDCLKQNTTYVRNIKKYLLASLFNAPSTMGSYYSALVNHDMYGDGLRGKG